MLKALSALQAAAEAAALAWEQDDLTAQQGLDIVWVLGNVIHDFRVATGLLSRFQVTAGPANHSDALNREISEASQCLDAARTLARTGESVLRSAIKSNMKRGIGAGGDPATDGPAVAAAHAMRDALGISAGTWRAPTGTAESRDDIVAEMMGAMAAFQTAVLTLAGRAPEPFHTSLTKIAGIFDISFEHMRESLVCSVTGNYQPGTESLAGQVRRAFPLRSEYGPADTDDPPAADLAAASFPRPAEGIFTAAPEAGLPGPGSVVSARRLAGPGHAAPTGRKP
jgi:hypothetical protein